ncbi:MAG: hypothetical protein ABW092_18380 [Candidatus Thiodiazotropha sp.]
MKKMTIAIAICSAISLTACSQSSDTESSNQTTSTDTMKEQKWTTVSEQQSPPIGQSAETGSGSDTASEQAAFEVEKAVNEKGEMIEDANKQ